jgi:hypothetical protein
MLGEATCDTKSEKCEEFSDRNARGVRAGARTPLGWGTWEVSYPVLVFVAAASRILVTTILVAVVPSFIVAAIAVTTVVIIGAL